MDFKFRYLFFYQDFNKVEITIATLLVPHRRKLQIYKIRIQQDGINMRAKRVHPQFNQTQAQHCLQDLTPQVSHQHKLKV